MLTLCCRYEANSCVKLTTTSYISLKAIKLELPLPFVIHPLSHENEQTDRGNTTKLSSNRKKKYKPQQFFALFKILNPIVHGSLFNPTLRDFVVRVRLRLGNRAKIFSNFTSQFFQVENFRTFKRNRKKSRRVLPPRGFNWYWIHCSGRFMRFLSSAKGFGYKYLGKNVFIETYNTMLVCAALPSTNAGII